MLLIVTFQALLCSPASQALQWLTASKRVKQYIEENREVMPRHKIGGSLMLSYYSNFSVSFFIFAFISRYFLVIFSRPRNLLVPTLENVMAFVKRIRIVPVMSDDKEEIDSRQFVVIREVCLLKKSTTVAF